VIYDPQDGRIVHIHKEITIAGGLERTEAEIEARARKFAAKPGLSGEGLKALFVKETRSKGRHHKVDTATLKLVEVELPK